MAASPADLLLAVLDALPGDADVAVVRRDPGQWVVGAAPDARMEAWGSDALDGLDRLGGGWWAGWLAYDLGRAVERVERRRPDDLGLPDVSLARFDARLVVGPAGLWLEGDGPTRPLLATAARRAVASGGPGRAGAGLGEFTSSLDRAGFEAGVRAVVDLVRAGECYQVNLTRRLTWERAADPFTLFGALVRHHPAPHAALLRFGDRAVVSASPERFLRRRGDAVETRPIKGTAGRRAALVASGKDRAENVMITDLSRNDLGRVCVPGSVAVPALCAPEAHPGLWHGDGGPGAGHVPAGVGHGGAQAPGAPGDRGPRAGDERRLLRGRRLDRRWGASPASPKGDWGASPASPKGERAGAQRGHPDLPDRRRADPPRGRGRDHRRLRPGGRMAGDGAQGGPPAGRGRSPREGRNRRPDRGTGVINPGHLLVWVDGALVEEHEARISPFDHGLLTGDGVFETLRVYRGQPYCWRRHYERLTRSASGMGLAIPPGPALRRAALDVIEANRLTDARLRITVTGGPSPLGSDRGRATPTLILAASQVPAPGPAQPIPVVTVPWPRNERGALAGLKTISYGPTPGASCARGRGPTCSS